MQVIVAQAFSRKSKKPNANKAPVITSKVWNFSFPLHSIITSYRYVWGRWSKSPCYWTWESPLRLKRLIVIIII